MTAELDILVLWVALLSAVAVGLWRVGRGPTTLDRMLGFDLITIAVISLVVVFSVATHSSHFIEFIFILSGLGFLTGVAYFYYLMQRSPDEDDFDARGQR